MVSCFLVLAILLISIPLTANAGVVQEVVLGSLNKLTQGILASLAKVFLSFFSLILAISAGVLNFTINYTIVDLRKNLETISAINTTWAAIRDLINLSFIFILLFAAIRTVLGLESPGKIIKNIVLAAIFINFSMFFARVMVDASNSVTLFFYDRLTDDSSTSSLVGNLKDNRANSLVNAYVGPLKLQGLYGAANPLNAEAGKVEDSAVDNSTIITVGILGSIMLALVAFVFFTISFMFIIRYTALILLLIFSPFGFVSKDLPIIGDYSEQWWTTLKSQLFFPPVFMVLTWVTLNVIAGISTYTKGTLRAALSAAGGNAPGQDDYGLLLNFIVIMTLIIMSLLISIETASKGSQALGGFYKKASKWAGGAMFGTAAFMGRKSLGKVGAIAAGSEALKNFATNNRVGRLALMGADYAQKGSFDVRGSTFGKNFASAAGIDAGSAGGQGGIRKQYDERGKRIEARAKLLETSQLQKDEAKARKAEKVEGIGNEMKVQRADLEKERLTLEADKKVFESSPEFIEAKDEVRVMDEKLNSINESLAQKKQAFAIAEGIGNRGAMDRITADIDALNNNKKALDEEKGRVSSRVQYAGDARINQIIDEEKKMKVGGEVEQTRIKAEAGNEEEDIKTAEKARKRAYAKSLKDTPTSISQETTEAIKQISTDLEKIDADLVAKQTELAEAQRAGNIDLTRSVQEEIQTLEKNKKDLDKKRRNTRVGSVVSQLASVSNLGVEGLLARVGAAGLNIAREKSTRLNSALSRIGIEKADAASLGLNVANREMSAKIRTGVIAPSKEKKLFDDMKKVIEEDAKKTGGDKDKVGENTRPDQPADNKPPVT